MNSRKFKVPSTRVGLSVRMVRRMKRRADGRAFTLTDWLVILGTITILAAILVMMLRPIPGKAKPKGRSKTKAHGIVLIPA